MGKKPTIIYSRLNIDYTVSGDSGHLFKGIIYNFLASKNGLGVVRKSDSFDNHIVIFCVFSWDLLTI